MACCCFQQVEGSSAKCLISFNSYYLLVYFLASEINFSSIELRWSFRHHYSSSASPNIISYSQIFILLQIHITCYIWNLNFSSFVFSCLKLIFCFFNSFFKVNRNRLVTSYVFQNTKNYKWVENKKNRTHQKEGPIPNYSNHFVLWIFHAI